MRTINGQEIDPSIFFNTFKIKTCIFYLKGKKLLSLIDNTQYFLKLNKISFIYSLIGIKHAAIYMESIKDPILRHLRQ